MDSDSAARISAAREELARIDLAIVALVAARLDQARAIGVLKAEAGLPMYAPEQEEQVLRRVEERASSLGIDPTLVRELFQAIVKQAREEQLEKEEGPRELP